MASRTRSFSQAVRDFWSKLTSKRTSPPETRPEVFLHDPAAQRPHDLDDAFFDPKVQARVAEVIAATARKKRSEPRT
jgi:hypothetical protein